MKNSQKMKVAILFGGKSGEHEVSIASAISVYNALDKNKYDVTLIGIDKTGRWLMPSEAQVLVHQENPRLLNLNLHKESISLVPYMSDKQIITIESAEVRVIDSNDSDDAALKRFDVILPILHGPHGEDGTIQGLLELSEIPYVGSGVLGSALGMDKDVSRKLLKFEGIPVVPTIVIRKSEYLKNKLKFLDEAIEEMGLPFFVKPANMGSSVGVHKVKTKEEALIKMDNAFLYDTKILVEKAIAARELECAVLGNEEPNASIIGEIIPQQEFYSYEAKYIDENGALLEIPAKNLNEDLVEKIKALSIKAFKVLECSGLARVDFFLDRETGALYLNEINTMPGFTKISMYPKLWEASGRPYSQLLDELIRLSLDKHLQKKSLKTSFEPNQS